MGKKISAKLVGRDLVGRKISGKLVGKELVGKMRNRKLVGKVLAISEKISGGVLNLP